MTKGEILTHLRKIADKIGELEIQGRGGQKSTAKAVRFGRQEFAKYSRMLGGVEGMAQAKKELGEK